MRKSTLKGTIIILFSTAILLIAIFFSQNAIQNRGNDYISRPKATEIAPISSPTPIVSTQTPEQTAEPVKTPELKDLFLIGSDEKPLSESRFYSENNEIRVYYGYSNSEKAVSEAKFSVCGDYFTEYSICETSFENTADTKNFVENGKIFSDVSPKPHGKYFLYLKSENDDITGYTLSLLPGANKIPVVSVYTDGGAKIENRLDYVHGSVFIEAENTEIYKNSNLSDVKTQIRGRGNASWDQTDKKAYRLKFDEKASVLGLNPDRDWVLVSNYFDKSLIRNTVALEMAKKMENLRYTPTQIAVDFFLNGKYMGVYGIGDKIEAASDKVDLSSEKSTGEDYTTDEPGFLIEEGWDYSTENVYGRDYFDTKLLLRLFLKEPKSTKVNSPELNYARSYIEKTEKAVVNNDNYEKYIDIDAMIDWFLIAELTNNTEMAFYRSTYFYKPADGKLVMGPVWDFDMAFGNHQEDVDGYNAWATAEATYHYVGQNWMTYLVKYPDFMKKVKARWDEKKDVLMETAFSVIDEQYELIAPSAEENFRVWNILTRQIGLGDVDYGKYNTYELQVKYVKEFLTERSAYITQRLSAY